MIWFLFPGSPGEAEQESREWTTVSEMGAIGMPFQQLLTENNQVIHTNTGQKNTEKILTVFWVCIKDTECLFIASKNYFMIAHFFLSISFFFLRKSFYSKFIMFKGRNAKEACIICYLLFICVFFFTLQSLSIYSLAVFEN